MWPKRWVSERSVRLLACEPCWDMGQWGRAGAENRAKVLGKLGERAEASTRQQSTVGRSICGLNLRGFRWRREQGTGRGAAEGGRTLRHCQDALCPWYSQLQRNRVPYFFLSFSRMDATARVIKTHDKQVSTGPTKPRTRNS